MYVLGIPVAAVGENFSFRHRGKVDFQCCRNFVRKFGLVPIEVGDKVGHGVRCASGITEDQNFGRTLEVCRNFFEIDVGVSVARVAVMMLSLSVVSMWSIRIGRDHDDGH